MTSEERGLGFLRRAPKVKGRKSPELSDQLQISRWGLEIIPALMGRRLQSGAEQLRISFVVFH